MALTPKDFPRARNANPDAPGLDSPGETWLRRSYRFTVILGVVIFAVGLRRFLQGAHTTALIEWLGVAALIPVNLWVAARPDPRRRRIGGHVMTGIGFCCVLGVAVVLGQSRSPSLYYVILVPLAAGYHSGPRAALGWGAVTVVGILAVAASERWFPLAPETPLGVQDVVSSLVIVTVLVSAFVAAAEQLLNRRERQLQAARDVAVAASRLKSRFLSNMSHEIRTPLTGVLGVTELLRATDLDAEQRRLADIIAASGETLLAIINDVLSLAKIEAGKVEIEQVPYGVHETVTEVARLYAGSSRLKGLTIAVDIAADVPPLVVGDRTRVLQVLSNLVSNAIKFTPAGEVRVQVSTTPGRLMMAVADDGVGVAPALLPRLFQAFEQADASTTRRFGGTGLGLAISSQLVELMGGRIGVDPDRARGARFWFELPLIPATAAPGIPPATTSAVGRRFDGLRVLVVEDNPVNLLIARRLLDRLGVEVSVATDGREAVARGLDGNHDLILMDCQMPVLDGFDATRALRDAERAAGRAPTPIIALTANAFAEDIRHCRAAGMDDHLPKPYTEEQLAQMLARWSELPVASR